MPEIENCVRKTGAFRHSTGCRPGNLSYYLAVAALSLLFIGLSTFYFFQGDINEDEGWYLYASKLVYEGQLPYRDFSFTQGPVLPFVYGVPQTILGTSLYIGRTTSMVLALGVLLLTIAIARRLNGRCAAVLAGLVVVLNPFTIYFFTITKTYALTAFLLSLAMFFVVSDYRPTIRYFMAALLLALCAGTRLSVIVAIPVLWGYVALVEKDRRIFMATLGASVVALGVIYLPLYLLAGDRMIFNLIGHHMGRYETTTMLEAVYSKLSTLRELVRYYPTLFIAGTIGLSMGAAALKKRATPDSRPPRDLHPSHLCIGAVLFGVFVANLLPGGSYAEYQVPLVPLAAVLVGSLALRLYRQIPPRREREAIAGGILIAVLVLSLNIGLINAKKRGASDMAEVAELSRRIEGIVPKDGVVYTLHPYLAVQSQRSLVPGTEMGIFSYYAEAETRTARHNRVINDEIAVTTIPHHRPDAVVLMDTDFVSSASYLQLDKADQDRVRNAIAMQLARCYNLLWQGDRFGQFYSKVALYGRGSRCGAPGAASHPQVSSGARM